MGTIVCAHRWRAGRVEVPAAVVEHVCDRGPSHTGPHLCACGAEQLAEGEARWQYVAGLLYDALRQAAQGDAAAAPGALWAYEQLREAG